MINPIACKYFPVSRGSIIPRQAVCQRLNGFFKAAKQNSWR